MRDQHYQCLLDNAKRIREENSGPIDLFFSGGIQSQLMLRSFLDCEINVNPIIVKYTNDYNIDDYQTAVKICTDFNLKYKTIDFDIESFFEHEAEGYYDKCPCLEVKLLPILKFVEYSDNLPVLATRSVYVTRSSTFYQNKEEWHVKITADELKVPAYFNSLDYKVIGDWFFYSTDVPKSFVETNTIKRLIADEFPGRISSHGVRGSIYRRYWKDFVDRPRSLEINSAGLINPEFVGDFFRYTVKKNIRDPKPLLFTYDQFIEKMNQLGLENMSILSLHGL